MPYSHYHDFSFHTHHQRPKGGRHYKGVRRRQRPWRIGFIVVLVAVAVFVAIEMGLRERLETALTVARQSATAESWREGPGREPEAEANQPGHEVVGGFTAPAAPAMTPTIPPPKTTPTPLVTSAVTRAGPAPISPAPNSILEVDQSAAVGPPPTLPPHRRHMEEKDYMLELINSERGKAGVNPVVLGTNNAAQLHAESSLADCVSSHWGTDGLKPYMRYSLAGGYQSNGENGHGSDYCIKASDRYRPISSIQAEIRDAMAGWMGSSGHRRNILGSSHMKVNIGMTWDRYNVKMFQHFEGDYVEYQRLPEIDGGVLKMSGSTRNGARLGSRRYLGVQIFYDPPPAPLTRGQVARTYCYTHGLQVASLRERLTGGSFWPEDRFTATYSPCPEPADVPADASAAGSHSEANRLWQEAYNQSRLTDDRTITVQWIDAGKFRVDSGAFDVEADISQVLSKHGEGVYSVIVWGLVDGQDTVISEYSIFHLVTPPDTYGPGGQQP